MNRHQILRKQCSNDSLRPASRHTADRQKTPPIYVTQPLLPPLEEFVTYLQEIWDNKILTNGGMFHQQLEQALRDHLGVKHISLFTNGTIALITGLQALRITGEVITTPFSFGCHSLLWNGITRVCGHRPDHTERDPDEVEAAITPQTTAIMPVHCYDAPVMWIASRDCRKLWTQSHLRCCSCFGGNTRAAACSTTATCGAELSRH
jgi:hypothetical protein